MGGYMPRSIFAVVATLTAMGLTCDSPNESKSGPPKDYIVYALIQGSEYNCFRYHTLTEEIDSVTLELPQTEIGFGQMAVSPDGQRLYVAAGWLAVVNASTLALERQLDWQDVTNIVASPDGQYLAVLGDSLHLLRTDDYSEVAVYPMEVIVAEFSGDANMLYFQKMSDTLFYVSLSAPDEIGRKHMPGQWPWYWGLAVNYDGSQAFAFFRQFSMYDRNLDSVVFQQSIQHGTGEVEISRDSRKVYISSPGEQDWGPANYSWRVFDVSRRAFTDSIIVSSDCHGYGWEPIGEFEMTPDGRLMIGIDGIRGLGDSNIDLSVYDLKTGKVNFVLCLPQVRFGLSCQSQVIE
jgi:hypothetical protein